MSPLRYLSLKRGVVTIFVLVIGFHLLLLAKHHLNPNIFHRFTQDWFHQRQIKLLSTHKPGRTLTLHGKISLTRAVVFSMNTRHGKSDPSWLSHYGNALRTFAYSVAEPNSTERNQTDPSEPVVGTYIVPANAGREASLYLTYIIDNYDRLADGNVFLHGHYQSWHQKSDLNGIVENINWDYDGFYNLRCVSKGAFPHICSTQYPIPGWRNSDDKYQRTFGRVWDNVMKPYGFGDELPKQITTNCCAQFFASKATIRANNISFYVQARNEIFKERESGMEIGMVMEFLWHIIFTRESIFCPAFEDCYCRAYHIC